MNKAQLIAEIAEAAGITKNDAAKMLNTTFDIIIGELVAGNEVKLSGFGKFYLKTALNALFAGLKANKSLTVRPRARALCPPSDRGGSYLSC